LEQALKKAAASSSNVDEELEEIDAAFNRLKKGDLGGLDDL